MNGPALTHAAPPRPPAARPAPRPAAVPQAEDNPALRVATYAKLHWLSILFCGALIGSGLAYVAYSVLPAKSESYALLYVASAPTYIGSQGDPNRGRTEHATFVQTTKQLLKSEFVLNSALNDAKYRIADLPTLSDKDPIKFLDEKLVVTNPGEAEVIRVSLEGDRPEDLRKIVDAVKDAYIREVVEREIAIKQSFRVQIDKAKTQLAEQLQTKSGLVVNGERLVDGGPALPSAAGGGVVTADGRGAAGGVRQAGASEPSGVAAGPGGGAAISETVKRQMGAMAMQRMFALQNIVDQYPVHLSEKQGTIDTLKRKIEALKTGAPAADAMAMAEKDPEVQQALRKAKQIRDKANVISRVGNNPAGRAGELEAAATEAEAEAAHIRDQKAYSLESSRRDAQGIHLTEDLDRAEREMRSMQERQRFAQQQLEDVRKDVAQIEDPKTAAERERRAMISPIETEAKTTDAQYASLVRQSIALEHEIVSPPRVRVMQPASTPREKDARKQIIGTVIAGLMGFALVGAGLVGYEASARKVSSLAELKSGTACPVVGVIPATPEGVALLDDVRRAEAHESVDKLRSYVAQAWLSRGATTVAVTSPVGDEGKAFVAFHLARSLAEAGNKTLLVDFDLRSPSLHVLAETANGAGACEMLRGETTPRDAVVGLPSGLWFLPAGQWSEQVRSCAVGDKLQKLLAQLKEPFDCVIVHGHSLLTAAESIELARRCEVVLLCSQYRETRMPLLKKAADRVAGLEVPYSGVVYLGATAGEAIC